MQTKFNYIEEFLSIRDRCIFCNTKLDFVFTNYFGVEPSLPLIKAKWKDNSFSFDFKYTTFSGDTDNFINIDTKHNVITLSGQHKLYAIRQLSELSPHVELQCLNRKCKMNYYLCSSIFKFREEEIDDYRVNPIKLEYESFNISKYWVKNDYFNKTTDIFSTLDDYNHKPIIVPMIDIHSMSGDKIKNKILTLITFS